MNYFTLIFILFSLTSCFRFNGQITIYNARQSSLKIETNPIISSGSGGWENGIHYYNKDSIIWTYSSGNNINAKIIQPNTWKSKDSTFVFYQSNGYHYFDYRQYRYDTTQNGIYAMYPNSSFTIGEFNTKKRTIPAKNNVSGHFSINKLIIYNGNDTLTASGDKEIWNLLLLVDKNNNNSENNRQHRKIRHWKVYIAE